MWTGVNGCGVGLGRSGQRLCVLVVARGRRAPNDSTVPCDGPSERYGDIVWTGVEGYCVVLGRRWQRLCALVI